MSIKDKVNSIVNDIDNVYTNLNDWVTILIMYLQV